MVRRIEQEEKVPSETVDQIFQDRLSIQPSPFDFYEQQYLMGQGRTIPAPESITFKDQINGAEQKLKKMNREYEMLKQRRFQVRRGRNNRIFCKSMHKTIFDYETDESTQEESLLSKKFGIKRNYQDRQIGDASYLERFMMNQ